jgi:hypothetical protein
MKYCVFCAEELPDDANFCSRCGKPQNAAPPEKTNETGKKIFFNIHLKPSTYGNKTFGYDDEGDYTLASKETVGIYLAWDNGRQKMRLGWIGHHPPSCGNCPHTECRAKTMRFTSLI